MRNEALFYKVAARIEERPDLYNQDVWMVKDACGTTCCIAGHTALEEGWRPAFTPLDVQRNGQVVSIEFAAGEALGLTADERSCLFNGGWMDGREDEVPDALRAIGRGAKITWYGYEDNEGQEI